MSKWLDIYCRKLHRKTWKELIARPKASHVLQRIVDTNASNHELCTLGIGIDGQYVTLSHEAYESNFHIIGSPREGKSKLIELLLRHRIDQNLKAKPVGALLLDPSKRGDTCLKVLKYAAKRGYEKICLIDPQDIWKFRSVPTINPLHYEAPPSAILGNLTDAIRVLWGTKDFADTPRIEKYIPALLAALHATGNEYLRKSHNYDGPVCTLAEVQNFMDKDLYKYRRETILQSLNKFDIHRGVLESAFAKVREWDGFLPTVNRLMPFTDPMMQLIFGSSVSPIDFGKLISEGYIILMNLDPTGIWTIKQQKLLATVVLSECQYAINRLESHGWRGRLYVYLDEAGLYATRALADYLYYHPKTGVVFTFAHHSFAQFEDQYVLEAIRNASKIKALFFAKNETDRRLMLKDLGYGGDLTDRSVSYALGMLKKQYCAISINKRPPVEFRLRDIPDTVVTDKYLTDYKTKLYHSLPCYRDPKAVREEINNRFAITKKPKPFRRDNLEHQVSDNPKTPQRGKGADRRTTSKGDAVFARKDQRTPDNPQPDKVLHVSWDLHPNDPSSKPPQEAGPGGRNEGD